MKHCLILICFFLPAYCYASAGNTTKLTVIFRDCRDPETQNELYFDTLFVYKLNGKLAGKYTVDTRSEVGWAGRIIINGFTPGQYKFKYKNLYDQWLEKKRTVANGIEATVVFCTDSTTGYEFNTLAELKDKDSLIISHHTSGCFGFHRDEFVICKTGGAVSCFFVQRHTGFEGRYSITLLAGHR